MKVNARACSRTALALLFFCSLVAARDLDQDEALRLRQRVRFCRLSNCSNRRWTAIPAPNCWRRSWKKSTTSTFMRSSC